MADFCLANPLSEQKAISELLGQPLDFFLQLNSTICLSIWKVQAQEEGKIVFLRGHCSGFRVKALYPQVTQAPRSTILYLDRTLSYLKGCGAWLQSCQRVAVHQVGHSGVTHPHEVTNQVSNLHQPVGAQHGDHLVGALR